MGEKILMKGNEAIGEAAIVAGCRHYFGYPITPQTELSEYMARRMPQVGGLFLQAESEVAAINMVYGASSAGARVMTSSSSPGISLKQEGLSYIAGAELPCVVINMQRGGPGLGSIQPAQGDYFQATKGGGHGDYRNIVVAPNSVQELVDMTILSFDLADKYRNTVLVLGDGAIGQMMEPVAFPDVKVQPPAKPWATTGFHGQHRKPNLINSLYLQPAELEKHTIKLQEKYKQITQAEQRWENILTDDAEIVVTAYGITSRVAQSAVERARADGIKAGLLRPITLWPFPAPAYANLVSHAKAFLCVEMSFGQMIEDVRLAIDCQRPVYFYGRTGGVIPTAKAVYEQIKAIAAGKGGVQ